MAEDEKPAVFPTDIKSLGEALDRAGVSRSCPRCGNQDWRTVTEEGYESGPAVWKAPNDFPMSHLRAISMSCTRCGFLSMHMLNVLMAGMEVKDDGE